MKRILALALILGLTALASPAQARWGTGRVDTWLADDGYTVGQQSVNTSPVPTMTVRVLYPSHERIEWVIASRGGESPSYGLTFSGCATGGGVGFRYFRPNGHEVTWRVVHDGYTVSVGDPGDTATLFVRVTWRAKRVERTCTLDAQGNSGTDSVNLHVITN
jgi:hypothetical protein